MFTSPLWILALAILPLLTACTTSLSTEPTMPAATVTLSDEEQVRAAQVLQWSADGAWLEVSLWDGYEGGDHGYRIRTDGSGRFEALP